MVRLLFILLIAIAPFALNSAKALAAAPAVISYPIKKPLKQDWSFSGPFGTYDRASLRRGFKIYREICAACHSLSYVRFYDLKALGFSRKELRDIASSFQIWGEADETGTLTTRPAKLSDYIASPFLNEKMARMANNGALPPDLSLITRSRYVAQSSWDFIWDVLSNYNEYGADYVASFLQGYETAPAGQQLAPGQYYNPYYSSGDSIAMAPPFIDGQVAYEDGAQENIAQYSYDIANFLSWAADPHLEERKRIGFSVLLFLLFFAFLIYQLKMEIFKDLEKNEPQEPANQPNERQ